MTKVTPIRLDEKLLERFDKLATVLSSRAGGVAVNRTDAIRAAVTKGLDALEVEYGIGRKR